MTGATAHFLGLTDRGVVAHGKAADIVVFDAATIADRGTMTNPSLAPVGVRYVVVNGGLVLDDGKVTGARPGRGLRRAGWRPAAPKARGR
jgi:N-acyl-D-amino-acid deacylase